jgi:hypothetical protein
MNEEDLFLSGLLGREYPVANLGFATGASNPASASAAEGYGGALGFNIGPRGGLVYRPWEMETWRDTGIPMELWNANLPGVFGGGLLGGAGGAGLGFGNYGGLTPEQLAALLASGGGGLPKNWEDYLNWLKEQSDKGKDPDKEPDKETETGTFTPPELSFLAPRTYTDHHDWFMNAPFEPHHIGTHQAALRRIYESEGGDRMFGDYNTWFNASKPERETIANQRFAQRYIPPPETMGAGLLYGSVPSVTVPSVTVTQDQGIGGGGPSAVDIANMAARDQAAENLRRANDRRTNFAPVTVPVVTPPVVNTPTKDTGWVQDALDAHNALFGKKANPYALSTKSWGPGESLIY